MLMRACKIGPRFSAAISSASIAVCGTRSYRPSVHTIKLTETREITPYGWVHPDDER
jgi:hypothetical protein